MAQAASEFVSGSDFISFGRSPSPPASSRPSRPTAGSSSLPSRPFNLPAKPPPPSYKEIVQDELSNTGDQPAEASGSGIRAPGLGSDLSTGQYAPQSQGGTNDALPANAEPNGSDGKPLTKTQRKKAREALKAIKAAKEKLRAGGKGKGKEKAGSTDAAGAGQKPSGKQKGKAKDVGPKNLKEERRAAERHAPWVDGVDWEACRDPAAMLNAEIDAYHRYVSPTREEFEVRLFMIELITRAIHRSWPDAEVTPFGSWQTQLYLPQGDIDLVVSTPRFNEFNKTKLLAELARAMRFANITDVVAIISKARVPIIKFVTLEGKLNVDISLNQTNGISAGKIINQYLDVLPGSRQLIMVVKAFLSQRSMNEVYTGGLGSYAVICLVISFLQIHPKLRRAEIAAEDNLGTLLIEFFELYGRNFYYDEVGISIRRGGSYYSKRARGWLRAGQPYLLSIEDPQDKDNDISGGSFGIRQVKSTLAGAYELLQGRLFERAEQIAGRRSGRYKESWDSDQMSILGGCMGIAKETQRHRQLIRELHQSGRLQRSLNIPTGADPSNHVQNYQPPAVAGSKRRHEHRSDDQTMSQGYANGGSKRQKGTSRVGAIEVEDGEVTFGEAYESDSDEQEGGKKQDNLNDGGESPGEEDDMEEVDELEDEVDDEVEERDSRSDSENPGQGGTVGAEQTVAHAGHNGRRENGRRHDLESVSHDSDEYEDERDSAEEVAMNEQQEDESRYALGTGTPRRNAARSANGAKGPMDAVEVSSDSSDDDDEDANEDEEADGQSDWSSILAIEPPQGMSARVRGARGGRVAADGGGRELGRAAGRAVNAARKEYWRSKGSSNAVQAGEADDFEDGADFVGLD